MTIIDDGVQGAKRQSMKNDPLLKVVRGVIDSIPAKEKDNMRHTKYARRFQDAIEKHPDSIDLTNSIFEYMWVRLVNRATKKPMTAVEKKEARAESLARVERNARVIDMGIQARAQKMFLGMTMPNGKELGACSFKEVRVMYPNTNKTMRFLVNSPAKDRQIVGEVYKTNEELLAAAKVR